MNYLSERNKNHPRAATLLLAAVCVLLFCAANAGAATYTVDTPNDGAGPTACTGAPTDCSLRGAISRADENSATDVVNFSVSSVTLDSPLPQIEEKLTVNGGETTVVGSLLYTTSCLPGEFAFDLTAAQVALFELPIYNVCSRAIKSNVPAPTIRVGPRRSDNTVSINGTGGGASVDIYRADPPAATLEASEFFDGVGAIGGNYARLLTSLPATGDKFTATAT
ncbi:MAG: hypothetical protein ACRDKE_00565, partial [Solirubrobacterales bacterium]